MLQEVESIRRLITWLRSSHVVSQSMPTQMWQIWTGNCKLCRVMTRHHASSGVTSVRILRMYFPLPLRQLHALSQVTAFVEVLQEVLIGDLAMFILAHNDPWLESRQRCRNSSPLPCQRTIPRAEIFKIQIPLKATDAIRIINYERKGPFHSIPFVQHPLPINQPNIKFGQSVRCALGCNWWTVAQLHTPKYRKPTIFSNFSKVPGLDPSTKVPNPRSSHDSALAMCLVQGTWKH